MSDQLLRMRRRSAPVMPLTWQSSSLLLLQRLLVGSGHGIQCYACNVKAGIIAVAEQVNCDLDYLCCHIALLQYVLPCLSTTPLLPANLLLLCVCRATSLGCPSTGTLTCSSCRLYKQVQSLPTQLLRSQAMASSWQSAVAHLTSSCQCGSGGQ
jgi:hypothetical protein